MWERGVSCLELISGSEMSSVGSFREDPCSTPGSWAALQRTVGFAHRNPSWDANKTHFSGDPCTVICTWRKLCTFRSRWTVVLTVKCLLAEFQG